MKAIRKVGVKKRRAAFVESEVSRWNRPDPMRKRCADLMEQMHTFLEGVNKTSLLEWARLLYIKHATRPGIGAEFAAIKDHDSLCAFIDRHDNPVAPLSLADLDAALKMGLLTIEQARELLKGQS